MKLSTRFKGKHLLLDTNIVIYQLDGSIDIADDLVAAASLNLSAISQAELFAGVAPAELINLKEFLANFRIIPVSSEVSTLAGAYKSALPHLGLKDLIISATAELGNFLLVTANRDDFKGINTVTPVFIDLSRT